MSEARCVVLKEAAICPFCRQVAWLHVKSYHATVRVCGHYSHLERVGDDIVAVFMREGTAK